jgi:uncharacterized membrane protein
MSPTIQNARIPLIDALRGGAIIAMVAFHFCFDLNYFHIIHQNFYESKFWIVARMMIVSAFLLLVGVSLVLAQSHGFKHFWRRTAMLGACALLVTLGSFMMFPESYIFFGILHFILVASLLGRVLITCSRLHLPLGIVLLAIGLCIEHPFFNHPTLQWIGLMTFKPVTEDYVPLLPWLGVVLIGMRLGQLCLTQLSLAQFYLNQHAPEANIHAAPSGIKKTLAWLGRNSLLIYMLHQPILLGLIGLFSRV